MDNKNFAHLHIHNEYSQLDGFGTADAYAERAATLGFKYLALTNHGNQDGLIKFQKACNKNGVKPILGCEGFIVPDIEKKSRSRGHILLLIKNKTGFTNLCKLLTHANLEGFYYRPRISYDMLLKHCEGLIVSTACMISFVRTHKEGKELFANLHDAIGDDLYCELMPHNLQGQIVANKKIVRLARRFDKKIIATNDCHYIKRTEWKAQEVLLAIQSKAKWNDPKRWRFGFKGLYLRSANEMAKALRKIGFYKKKYLTNTIEIAEKCCDFQIEEQDISLPRIRGAGVPLREKEFLLKKCEESFEKKFKNKEIKNTLNGYQIYNKRLKEEYDLIVSKNFTRYFLIVWELINWCRKNNILVGPGRGSVGGSLIAYFLGITAVDPIKYDLLFSRFINEDRVDYPDIDIDFEDTKRHIVRTHIEEMYGKDKVAGVSSFNRMKAKAVMKDVGRVFAVPFNEVNEFTKLIEDNDEHTGIQTAIEEYEEGKEFYKNNKTVVKLAQKLEGQIRGYSQHAAGIVVSKEKIGHSGRCNLIKHDNALVVNWEKNDTEYVGLMKLDILGLKLMSVLAEAKRLIEENHDKDIEFEKINTEDEEVLKEIDAGNTVGLFQLNAWPTTNLCKEVGIEEFRHISDVVALVRPGPMNSGMTEQYIVRKHGAKWEKKHKVYESLTKDTYGILVYQEQVMAVINKVAGLPYSTADKIRKIIGKKRDVKEFQKYYKKFLRGCKKKKIFSQEEATEFWDGLQKWAKYGFNKSHSVEYALLGYWCGWLKKYFPTEFLCASLTYGAKGKKAELVEEAYRLGLKIVLPKVNLSNAVTWKAKSGNLYIPFIEVKGIGKVKAYESAISTNKLGIKRFYKKQDISIKRHKGALGKLLAGIGAYDQNNTTQISQETKDKFDFRVSTDPRSDYEKLFKLFKNDLRLDKLDKVLAGDISTIKGLKRRLIRKNRTILDSTFFKKLIRCNKCELREEANAPVAPSQGLYNLMAIGEAPGPNEDIKGEGFIGAAGKKMWRECGRRKIKRKDIHVTNMDKCYPKFSRKPSSKQIKTCSKLFLEKEIKSVRPVIILAFGNTCLEFFTGKKSGIMNMSGKALWNEKYGCWIAWCLHPAATLHNPDNEVYFKEGIKTFARLVRALGLNK